VFRKLCQVTKPEQIVPIVQLKKYINNDIIFAFNRGTKGIEQKTSVLGIDLETKEEFFIKYANTELARENVNNEGKILKQLAFLEFVPQLKQHINEAEFTFIQTSVFKGERVVNQNIERQILGVLKRISSLKVVSKNECHTALKTCFAHGDFCPWNMMLNADELQVYDWEMAQIYPIGYDLFTYIFQTSFLLTPSKKNRDIINENNELMNNYFVGQDINDWTPYLSAFSAIKLKLETEKDNQRLMSHYKELIKYVPKA
tara:strand:- start:170 stop:943 length:774 start_codon:yes stop_codon:yes gene_type:complete